jgi:DNA polymerase-1
MTAKRLYLIDGSGYIFRAFHALPPMSRPDGTPVNAVYGFASMLLKLLDDLRDHSADELIAVVYDAGRTTFRNQIYDQYKANRPEPPPELIPQFALIRDATRAFNVPCVEREGYEADDLIATYAKQAQAQGIADIVVVSADKDLMQLIRPGVRMLDPIKNRPIGPEQVQERFGVPPEKVVDVQALAGDSSDNVPGVPGIGVKTAAELILQFGDLETLLERAGEIKQPKRRENLLANADMARTCKRLVTLNDDVPIEVPLQDLTWKEPDQDTLINFITGQGFKSLVPRVTARLNAGKSAAAKAAAPAVKAVTGRGTYECIQRSGDLARWVDQAIARGRVGIEVATDSRDPMNARLLGLALAVEPGGGAYVPLRHVGSAAQGDLDLAGAGGSDAPAQIALSDALAILKPLFGNDGVLKIGHDVKFAMHVLAREGVALAPTDDTMVLCYVLEGSKHGAALADAASALLEHETMPLDAVCGRG